MFRSFLISLSQNAAMRRVMERSAPGRRVSSRFVAGLTVEDALRVTRDLNAQGFAVTADALGESVQSEAQAKSAADVYHQLLDGIAAVGLNANVSVKLTGIGMDVSQELGASTAEEDTTRLLRQGIRIRLCKGAYKEPANLAFPQKSDVDANYAKLMQAMLPSGVFCGIATHDEAMVAATEAFAAANGIARNAFELQMLYGVRRDLQRTLVAKGYGVRVYLPFGTEWYPYFMRRLAERPANVLFLLKNLFKS
jgi:proline dehydrogenase